MTIYHSQPILPQEVIEEIIDNLSCDLPALRTCSLVSRAWLPRSRYHLWSITLLSDRDEAEKTVFFQDTVIASLICQLTVSSTDRVEWVEWLPKVLNLTEKMTNVISLRIQFHQNAYLGDGYFRAQASSLVHLILDGVKFDSFATFTYVVAAFPKLESLSLLYVRWTARLGPARLEDRADGSALNLRTLRLGWSLVGKLIGFLSWLLHKRTTPLIVQSLALGIYHFDESPFLFLRQLSPNLREIEFFQRVSTFAELSLSRIDATLVEPLFANLEAVVVTGIIPPTPPRVATAPEALGSAFLHEKLPLLSKRKEVKLCVRSRQTDPTWVEA